MAKTTVRIAGVIIPNDYKWYYDYMDMDSTCPDDVRKAVDEADGGLLDVEINSPGGEIASGSEIYSMLRQYGNIKIHVTGQACSAASVIAMAGKSDMAPTALMMVHCVSTAAEGNHNDFEHAAETLRTADEALSTAYMQKSGMTRGEVLAMMEAETWITAEQAVELGLIDGVAAYDGGLVMAAGVGFALPSQERLEAARRMIKRQHGESSAPEADIKQAKLDILKSTKRRKKRDEV